MKRFVTESCGESGRSPVPLLAWQPRFTIWREGFRNGLGEYRPTRLTP